MQTITKPPLFEWLLHSCPQVEAKLSQLSEAESSLEGEEQLKAEVLAWISDQKSLISDWKQKPCKIKTESAQAEIAKMQDLKGVVLQKQTEGVLEDQLGEIITLVSSLIWDAIESFLSVISKPTKLRGIYVFIY